MLKIGDSCNDGIEVVEIILAKLRKKLKSYVQFQEKNEKWKVMIDYEKENVELVSFRTSKNILLRLI